MIKIMFLCHGNICRSPMTEYVMKDLVEKASLEKHFDISSGAVSDEEWFNPIYPPAQRKLREKGVRFGNHSAHKISPAEFEEQDLIIVMDNGQVVSVGNHEKLMKTSTIYQEVFYSQQKGGLE